MSEDFDVFPLAVVMRDATSTTLEIRRPNTGGITMPPWGNECLWTDPPPDHCFKTPPLTLCQLGPEVCNVLPKGVADLGAAMAPKSTVGAQGLVADDIDLSKFPPHILPLIQVLGEAARQAEIDLEEMDTDGLTIIFHDKR